MDALNGQIESLGEALETAKADALAAEAEATAKADSLSAQVSSLTTQLETTLSEKAAGEAEAQAKVDALSTQVSGLSTELTGVKADKESEQLTQAAAYTKLEQKLAESESARVSLQGKVFNMTSEAVYWNNTVCTFGIHLRDILPSLTDKWYTVTPIDLSQDGSQSFELVAGNMWIIGSVTVTVEGDQVLIERDIIKEGIGRTRMVSEYVTFFNDLNSITPEALEQDGLYGRGYSFGQPLSIEKDLGGDTNVLLYVRSVATFNPAVTKDQFLVRMWKNLPHRIAQRDAMLALMEPYQEAE